MFEAVRAWKKYVQQDAGLKDRIKENRTQEMVFVNRFGKVRDYQGLRKQFDRYLKDNGLGQYHLTFHKIRHFYATVAHEHGVEVNTISQLLGHKDSIVTTQVYITPRESSLKRGAKILNKAMGSIFGSDDEDDEDEQG